MCWYEINNFYIKLGYGCAEQDKPGVYAKVTSFSKWIDDKISL